MGFSPILIDLLLMTIRDTWRTEKDGFIRGEEKVNNDGEMEHFIFAKAYYPGQDHSLYLMTLLVYFGHTIFRRWAMCCFTYYTKKVEQGTNVDWRTKTTLFIWVYRQSKQLHFDKRFFCQKLCPFIHPPSNYFQVFCHSLLANASVKK